MTIMYNIVAILPGMAKENVAHIHFQNITNKLILVGVANGKGNYANFVTVVSPFFVIQFTL